MEFKSNTSVIIQNAVKAASEIENIASKVSVEDIESLFNVILSANKIFISGAGRSLLVLRTFAMRLMHIGFEVYVVGDTTTPAFNSGDLLIVGSGSGETAQLITIAKAAKSYKGKVAVLSIFDDSSLSELADVLVKIPAYTDKLPESESNVKTTLPGASTFEISMMLLLDSLIITLAEAQEIRTDTSFERHANLE